MAYDLEGDKRLDPRVKAMLAFFPVGPLTNVSSRDEVVALSNTPEALEGVAQIRAILEMSDSEEVAPSTGLRIEHREVISQPDDNTIKLQIIRPDNEETLPCIYYIHGGGMAVLSSFDGNYRAWSRVIASKGVCVVMVEFRNSLQEGAVSGIEPFPAGLNDCESGLRWTIEHAAELNIDAEKVTVAGESGGGNLSLALTMKLIRSGDVGLIKGVYALCPYINGSWPDERYPSTTENNGILLDLHNNRWTHAYGYEEFEKKNPLAWPGFATEEDVAEFPPTVISINECDPLRDEGWAFYQLLLRAGVSARGRMVLGTSHAAEIFPIMVPDISHSTASDMAYFASH